MWNTITAQLMSVEESSCTKHRLCLSSFIFNNKNKLISYGRYDVMLTEQL